MEQRYKTGDTPWEKGEASPGLIDFLRETPPPVKGSVLVPGCGFGRDARAWAEAGWPAVDWILRRRLSRGTRGHTEGCSRGGFVRRFPGG